MDANVHRSSRNLFDTFQPSTSAKRQRRVSTSSSSDLDLTDEDDWQPLANADSSSDSEAKGNEDEDFSDATSNASSENHENKQAETDTMVSKDGTIWHKDPPAAKKCAPQNIVRKSRKVTDVDSPLESLELIINHEFLSIVVKNTNLEGERQAKSKKKQWTPTDDVEIKALIGKLLAIGSLSQNLVSLKTITDDVWGNPFVRSLFSYNRLLDLLVVLRFDDKDLRSARKEKDPLAPIRELWDCFERQLKRHYTPGHYLTVDEQLVPFRGRCKFRMYIPNKPDKYGLKIYWLCDAETSYPLRALPYLGKVSRNPEKNHGVNVVLHLVEPYHRSGRNVTCDSFFTTHDLVKSLKQKGLTCVGTVKKDKRFIPDSLRHENMKKKEINTNEFAFQDDSMLVTYKSKKNKCVTILSSMHATKDIEKPSKNKTEVVCFYNSTKGGVDNMDQMAKQYTCKRKSRRWPLVYFFNMLDISCLAARIIFQESKPNDPHSHQNARPNFIREVAGSLAAGHLQRRSLTPTLSKELRLTIEVALSRLFPQNQALVAARTARLTSAGKTKASTPKSKGKTTPSTPKSSEKAKPTSKPKQQRCAQCDWKKDKKVTTRCAKCSSFVCSEHRDFLCKKCIDLHN